MKNPQLAIARAPAEASGPSDSPAGSGRDPHGDAWRSSTETELEVRLIKAALKHGRLDALPGPRALWEDPAKEPTHCLWQPAGQAGYAVPLDALPRLMRMTPTEQRAYLDAHGVVVVPPPAAGSSDPTPSP